PRPLAGAGFRLLTSLAALLIFLPLAWAEKPTKKPAKDGQQKASEEEAYFKGKPTSFWIKRLQDKDVAVRREAVEALAVLGPGAGAAVPALLRALKDDDDTAVRVGTLYAFCNIGPAAKAAVGPLLRALKDKDVHFRSVAIRALAAIGP